MANVKKAGVDAANTVELIPTLAQFNYCDPKTFADAGWELEKVFLRGQGGINGKKEHYDERELFIPLGRGRKLTLPIKDRMYSLFRSVAVEGRDMPTVRKWAKKHLPFFSISITVIKIRHIETGHRVSCRVIGRATKNIMSKKFIAHMLNGKKLTPKQVPLVHSLLDELSYNLCSYDYSAGKRNVICDA